MAFRGVTFACIFILIAASCLEPQEYKGGSAVDQTESDLRLTSILTSNRQVEYRWPSELVPLPTNFKAIEPNANVASILEIMENWSDETTGPFYICIEWNEGWTEFDEYANQAGLVVNMGRVDTLFNVDNRHSLEKVIVENKAYYSASYEVFLDATYYDLHSSFFTGAAIEDWKGMFLVLHVRTPEQAEEIRNLQEQSLQ